MDVIEHLPVLLLDLAIYPRFLSFPQILKFQGFSPEIFLFRLSFRSEFVYLDQASVHSRQKKCAIEQIEKSGEDTECMR